MRLAPLAATLLLSACTHRAPPPAETVRYRIGPAYELAGVWYYPRESFQADETGLAERIAGHAGPTADGEAFDPAAMAGAHRTLQLPAIASVTNLDNGRQIVIRLNDRGPANPGRLLGLTNRAADLLGLSASPAPIRLHVESAPSQALRDRLQGAPGGVTAAPVAVVASESLAPPGGKAAPTRTQPPPPPEAQTADAALPDRLPETVAQGAAQPGQLWLHAGKFTGAGAANTVKSRLSALPVQIRREGPARAPDYVVVAGPFPSVADADNALDRARAAGVTDAAIVVE